MHKSKFSQKYHVPFVVLGHIWPNIAHYEVLEWGPLHFTSEIIYDIFPTQRRFCTFTYQVPMSLHTARMDSEKNNRNKINKYLYKYKYWGNAESIYN